MKKLCFVLVIGLLMVGAQADAQTLYGTIHNGGTSPSSLVELDPVTGAQIAVIGSVGYVVNGMAWDATTGTLFGSTATGDPSFPNGLITINPMTGAGTPIGTGNGLGNPVVCITVDAAGNLYGWLEPGDDDLVIFDKVAGTATLVGESGLNTWSLGLDFDAAGDLYLVNPYFDEQGFSVEVFEISTVDGSSTSVGVISGLMEEKAHHGKFNPADGYYYGIDRTLGGGEQGFNMVVLDIGSMSLVRTFPIPDSIHTVVFMAGAQPPAEEIPTLSGIGMVLMVMIIAGAAVVIARRFI